MEQGRSSKRQAQAAATREQLVDAARAVFAARGYQATTVGAITKAADTAHGTFYLYFRNKEDVFSTVVEDLVLELYDRTWDTTVMGTGREQLDAGIRSFLDVFVRHAGIWRCLLEGAFTTPSVEAMWCGLRSGFIARVSRWLHQLQDQGHIRVVDPDLTANALGGMVEWTATTQFILRTPPSEGATIDDVARTLADLWHHALTVEVDAQT